VSLHGKRNLYRGLSGVFLIKIKDCISIGLGPFNLNYLSKAAPSNMVILVVRTPIVNGQGGGTQFSS
jgi:hypothetical protein